MVVNKKAVCKNCLNFLGMKESHNTEPNTLVIMGITCSATPVGDWVTIQKDPNEHFCGMGVWEVSCQRPMIGSNNRKLWHEIYEHDEIVERSEIKAQGATQCKA